jgi:CheY-like chemotaxis protein
LANLNRPTDTVPQQAQRDGLAEIWLSNGDHEKDQEPGARARADGPEGSVRTVLIVEDELLIAWHLEDLIKGMNHQVCGVTARGEDAVARIAALGADLVLMDVNLAGQIDGIEAARRIRAATGAPIIFITAYSDRDTLERIESVAPGSVVLQKPITVEALARAVAAAIKPRRN